MELRVYHLTWERYIWDEIDFADLTEKRHKGVYQVYGTHPAYGRDSLLYIGKTTEQTFGRRLGQHWDFDVNHFTEFSSLCIGMLLERDDVTTRNYKKIIDKIEPLLINAHCPAFNSNELKGIRSHSDKDQFVVINWGNYDQMLPEISTLKFGAKYWDPNKYYDQIILDKKG